MQPRKQQCWIWTDSIKPSLRFPWICVFFVSKGNPFWLLLCTVCLDVFAFPLGVISRLCSGFSWTTPLLFLTVNRRSKTFSSQPSGKISGKSTSVFIPFQYIFANTKLASCIILALKGPDTLSRLFATSRKEDVIITKSSLLKYTENFTTKKWRFSDKNIDIFHISAQNTDCAYSLEPPQRGGSNEYPQSMFLSRNKKNNVYLC